MLNHFSPIMLLFSSRPVKLFFTKTALQDAFRFPYNDAEQVLKRYTQVSLPVHSTPPQVMLEVSLVLLVMMRTKSRMRCLTVVGISGFSSPFLTQLIKARHARRNGMYGCGIFFFFITATSYFLVSMEPASPDKKLLFRKRNLEMSLVKRVLFSLNAFRSSVMDGFLSMRETTIS